MNDPIEPDGSSCKGRCRLAGKALGEDTALAIARASDPKVGTGFGTNPMLKQNDRAAVYCFHLKVHRSSRITRQAALSGSIKAEM